MEIIHLLDDFFYSLFPEIQKGDSGSLKEALLHFYRVGIYEPTVTVDDTLVRVVIDLDVMGPMNQDYKRIISLCEKGNFADAKILLLPLVHQFRTHSELHRLLGQIESELGNQEEAIHSLIDALRWDSKNTSALLMMGNIFLRFKKEPEIAMRYYNQALVVNPEDSLTANNIAATLMQMNQWEKAEEFLQKAEKSNPSFPNTHYGLGLLYEEKREFPKAFESFLTAVKVNPKRDELFKQSLHKLFGVAQTIVDSSLVEDVIAEYLRKMVEGQGTDIRIEKSESIPYSAKIEYAELYDRDYHLIRYQPHRPAVAHLVMHELAHLQFTVEAKKAHQYKLITSDEESKNLFKIQIASFTSRLAEKGVLAGGGTRIH